MSDRPTNLTGPGMAEPDRADGAVGFGDDVFGDGVGVHESEGSGKERGEEEAFHQKDCPKPR